MRGLDISNWQANLDLNAIDYDFVVVKATGGTGYVDKSCDKHFQQAKAAGKKRGVYHFRDDGYPGTPEQEADFFLKNIEGYLDKHTMLVLDWEMGNTGDVAWAKTWLDHVAEKTGVKPVIYMSESVVNSHDWSSVIAGNYGLWVAKYRDYDPDYNYDMANAGSAPNVKWGTVGYLMWQWTSAGRLNGYGGNLDLNEFYGDANVWEKYCGGDGTTSLPPLNPAPTPPAQPAQDVYVVKSGDTLGKIAADHGTTFQKIAADNGIANPNIIFPGQRLVINGGSAGRTAGRTYTVAKGDNLSSIGAKFGMNYTQIAQMNGISNPNLIFPGQVLIIP